MEKHGLWISPALVGKDDLTWQEKSFLALIANLSQSSGCFASNRFIGAYFGITENRVSKILSSLRKKGYLRSYKSQGEYGQNAKRCMEIMNIPDVTNGNAFVGEKAKHNKYNNKNINKNLYSKKTKFNNYTTTGDLGEFERQMLIKRIKGTEAVK